MGARGFFTYMCCSSLLDSGLVVFPLDLIYLHAESKSAWAHEREGGLFGFALLFASFLGRHASRGLT